MDIIKEDFLPAWPSTSQLRDRARRRMPGFAFDYLDGGCNEDVNLRRNCTDIQQVELMPEYLTEHPGSNMQVTLFDREYDAPFGVDPVGLQGMMWPNSPEVLAQAAVRHNVPFILSTVTTSSIERIGEITEGNFWFQLYHPREDEIRNDILKRAQAAGCDVLVALCDVPAFGYRPRELRNGLAMPPRMTARNVVQMLGRPRWVMQTLRHGKPQFATIKKYMPEKLNLKQLGQFMNDTFQGRLQEHKLAKLRELWPGKVIVKGIVSHSDAERCVKLGVDGILVSNHGGRQLDAGESTINSLIRLVPEFGDKLTIMIDGGIRSGPDIARVIACGAKFAFMGRTFMYAVGALGERGGNHVMAMMKMQLQQVMEQLCCQKVEDLPSHLIQQSLSLGLRP